MLLSSVEAKNDAFWKFGKDKKQPRVMAVFVDMSGSTNKARRTLYRNAFEKIYQNLQQGDRIIVGTITGRSYIDFKPVVDAEIPKQSLWVNRISYEQNLAKTKKDIQTEVEKLLSRRRGTPRTEIINSLNIADKIFHNEKRQKILIILSDMVPGQGYQSIHLPDHQETAEAKPYPQAQQCQGLCGRRQRI
jgi:hypothetical protein